MKKTIMQALHIAGGILLCVSIAAAIFWKIEAGMILLCLSIMLESLRQVCIADPKSEQRAVYVLRCIGAMLLAGLFSVWDQEISFFSPQMQVNVAIFLVVLCILCSNFWVVKELNKLFLGE